MRRGNVRWLAWLSMVAIGLLASGCGSSQGTAAVTLGDNDSGRTVTLARGQQLVLRLAANGSTGFSWQTSTAPDNAILQTVSSEYVAAASGVTGASGTQVLTYQAVASGQTTIGLIYVQPWNPGDVATRFNCTVNVN